ncbi:MAG TPA: trigger factor [Acetobacteraceae bacterium]|nr:trigger factor [Acetobacteraceae bacterium]
MQVTETLSEGLKRGFAVTVPASDIEEKRTKRLAELGKTVKLPGFRPGKVPLSVVRQRFGTAVMSEVLEESVNTATQQVLTDRGLRAATQPKVDVTKLEDKQDLQFTVELELLPEINLPDFGAIQLTRLKAAASDEAVDKAVAEIANRQRELEPVTEDRGAQAGDVLTVDFVGKVDGVAFPGGTGTDVAVELGAGGFIPGFSEGMEGMRPGEERQVSVTFPETYHAQDLAGKAATFDVTAKSIQQRKPAVLDDSLAEKLGFDNLGELRDLVRGQIQREYDSVSRMRIKRELLDALASGASFPVPQSMVDTEFGSIWQRVEADLKQGKLEDEDKGKDEETLKAEYRAIAERRVRLGLLLSEIGRANGLQVTPDEMTRAMRAEAGRYPGQEQQVMEFFRKNPQAAENLRGPIYEDKVVDFILELAKVEERTVTPEELAAEPAGSGAAAEAPASES